VRACMLRHFVSVIFQKIAWGFQQTHNFDPLADKYELIRLRDQKVKGQNSKINVMMINETNYGPKRRSRMHGRRPVAFYLV